MSDSSPPPPLLPCQLLKDTLFRAVAALDPFAAVSVGPPAAARRSSLFALLLRLLSLPRLRDAFRPALSALCPPLDWAQLALLEAAVNAAAGSTAEPCAEASAGYARALARAWHDEYETRRWLALDLSDFLRMSPLPEPSPLGSEEREAGREREAERERARALCEDRGGAAKDCPADPAEHFRGPPRPARVPPEAVFLPPVSEALLDCFGDATLLGPALAPTLVVSWMLEDVHIPARLLCQNLRRSLEHTAARTFRGPSSPRPVLAVRFVPKHPATAAPAAPWVWLEGAPLRRMAFYPGVAASFALPPREELLDLATGVLAWRENLWLRFEGADRSYVSIVVVAG